MDRPISSQKGLVSIGKVKGLPLIDNYNSHPVLCQGFMVGLLQSWCSKAEAVIKNNKEVLPISDVEAMRFYLERTEENADQVTLCYRIIFECKQALKFLEKSEGILRAAYGLEEDTITKLKRSGAFEYDEQSISYQAAYHVFQAQYCMYIAQLLGSEDIIMHGQKGIKNLRNARKDSAESRNKEQDYQRWQAWAHDVWKKNPSHSVSCVAQIIKDRHLISQSTRTIRNKIKKVGSD